ncbi:hypothetical protein AB1Y20_013931 [Prymnesium parvum]|uniref:S-adenosylmethionine:tRNA ribosyltransferase-isomerase n=1 Tax=Prymnesium parvum TaxID=97485 RepID=A0AB34IGW3_PRYPA
MYAWDFMLGWRWLRTKGWTRASSESASSRSPLCLAPARFLFILSIYFSAPSSAHSPDIPLGTFASLPLLPSSTALRLAGLSYASMSAVCPLRASLARPTSRRLARLPYFLQARSSGRSAATDPLPPCHPQGVAAEVRRIASAVYCCVCVSLLPTLSKTPQSTAYFLHARPSVYRRSPPPPHAALFAVRPSFPSSHPSISHPADYHPSQVRRQDSQQFRYNLPSELIAVHPAEPRGSSRLLVYVPSSLHLSQFARGVRENSSTLAAPSVLPSGGTVTDLTFPDLPKVLPPDVHLIFNESRVFSARLLALVAGAPGSPPIEVLFLAPLTHTDPADALTSPADGQLWRAMVRTPLQRGGAKLEVAQSKGHHADLLLEVEEILAPWVEDGEVDGVEAAVRLSTSFEGARTLALSHLLSSLGEIPIPPYLRRAALPEDEVRYQTVYAAADQSGSVAAPTAGLHFTPELLASLSGAGARASSLTLHVGAGTFKPVVAPSLGSHAMHAEPFSITADAIDSLAQSAAEGRAIVPVGTTSARVAESLYWFGVKRSLQQTGGAPSADLGHLDQWEAYEIGGASKALPVPRVEALARLHAHAVAAGGRLYGSTALCIAPGYSFSMCDGLVTNFHAPDSTLMCLVSAIMGGAKTAHEVYAHAIARRYSFLSYGDSSLLLRSAS